MVKKEEKKKVVEPKKIVVVTKKDTPPETGRNAGLKLALKELQLSIDDTKAKLAVEDRPEYLGELNDAYDVLLAQKEKIELLLKL